MAKTCMDCFYAHVSEAPGKWKCEKKHRLVGSFDTPCGEFVSDEKPGCYECMFCEVNTSLFSFGGSYTCTKYNKKLKGTEPSCSRFIPE